jgi:pyridoxamine 5'-phosphate oxidase
LKLQKNDIRNKCDAGVCWSLTTIHYIHDYSLCTEASTTKLLFNSSQWSDQSPETPSPWRFLLDQALNENRHFANSRFPQLATIGLDGRPANRSVVFRGFEANTDYLQFVTDARSAKVMQISQQPAAELCWYFAHTREQFRIAGDLIPIGSQCPNLELQASRNRLWQQLSDAARLQFTWPSPGSKRQLDQPFPSEPPSQIEPLPNFCLLLLMPLTVDHLCLQGDPQSRWYYTWDADANTWNYTVINP